MEKQTNESQVSSIVANPNIKDPLAAKSKETDLTTVNSLNNIVDAGSKCVTPTKSKTKTLTNPYCHGIQKTETHNADVTSKVLATPTQVNFDEVCLSDDSLIQVVDHAMVHRPNSNNPDTSMTTNKMEQSIKSLSPHHIPAEEDRKIRSHRITAIRTTLFKYVRDLAKHSQRCNLSHSMNLVDLIYELRRTRVISTDFQEIMLEIDALGLLASDQNAPLPSKLLIDLLMEAYHKEMALQKYSQNL